MSRKTYALTKRTTYLECIDEIPPAYCRLIAREKRLGRYPRILTITQIAKQAGMTWQKVAAIARQKSFARVAVEDADRFRLGCGITLKNEKRHREFIVRLLKHADGLDRYFRYAKNGLPTDKWHSRYINRIVKHL